MNKVQLGLASLVISSCATINIKIEDNEYKGFVIQKNKLKEYSEVYNSRRSKDYGVVIRIFVDDFDGNEFQTYYDKNLWNNVDTDTTLIIKGKSINSYKYRNEKLVNKFFGGVIIDSIKILPKKDYIDTAYFDTKHKRFISKEKKIYK